QHHAYKERDDEQHAIHGLWGSAPRPMNGGDPGEQQKERQVDAHGGAADIEELDRPTHGEAPPLSTPTPLRPCNHASRTLTMGSVAGKRHRRRRANDLKRPDRCACQPGTAPCFFGRTSSAPGQMARDTRAYWGG